MTHATAVSAKRARLDVEVVKKDHLNRLPVRVIACIYTFLPAKDVLAAERVSHSLATAVPFWGPTLRALNLDASWSIPQLAALFSTRQLPKQLFPHLATLKIDFRRFEEWIEPGASYRRRRAYSGKLISFGRVFQNLSGHCRSLSDLTISSTSNAVVTYYLLEKVGKLLKRLELRDCYLPDISRYCPQLKEVALTGSTVKDHELLKSALKIPQLTELELSDFDESDLEAVGKSGRPLTRLILSAKVRDPTVTNGGLEHLKKCTRLQHLRLEFPVLTFLPWDDILTTAKLLELLEHLKELKTFVLNDTPRIMTFQSPFPPALDISLLREALGKTRPDLHLDLKGPRVLV